MDVNKLMIDPGADWLYSPEFKTLIESHLNFIRTDPSTKVITVTPDNVSIYRHDFYGLLTSIKIKPRDFWVILRLNNMHNPQEFNESTSILYVPDNRLLEQIKMAYRSVNAIVN